MPGKTGKWVKFYGKAWETGERRLFTFSVFSEKRARRVLQMYGAPYGFYVVWIDGVEKVNVKISP